MSFAGPKSNEEVKLTEAQVFFFCGLFYASHKKSIFIGNQNGQNRNYSLNNSLAADRIETLSNAYKRICIIELLMNPVISLSEVYAVRNSYCLNPLE